MGRLETLTNTIILVSKADRSFEAICAEGMCFFIFDFVLILFFNLQKILIRLKLSEIIHLTSRAMTVANCSRSV